MKLDVFIRKDEGIGWIATTFIPIEGNIYAYGETPEYANSVLKNKIREFIAKKELLVREIEIN